MKLFYSPSSPFARKVRMAAHELGLELELVSISPMTDPALRPLNPISQVPTLVRDDGDPLFDSPLICEYLDALGGGRLIPAAGPARWAALKTQAVADGVAELAVRRVMEARRPQGDGHADWMERWLTGVLAGLDVLDGEGVLGDGFAIGEMAAAAAISYLDFRMPDLGWRETRPALSAWYAAQERRPAMQATVLANL